MGIIGPLARRTGPSGTVMALDNDALQLRAARQYAESEALQNVEFLEGDLFTVDLPAGAFDLVHARFVLAPLGRNQEVLDRLTYLARDEGLIALDKLARRKPPPGKATFSLLDGMSHSCSKLRHVVEWSFAETLCSLIHECTPREIYGKFNSRSRSTCFTVPELHSQVGNDHASESRDGHF